MKKLEYPLRYASLAVFFILITIVYTARLVNIQISGQDYYSPSDSGTYTRREIIYAARGEIFDRNGIPLVANEYSKNVVLSYGEMPSRNSQINATVSELLSVIRRSGQEELLTDTNFPVLGEAPDFYFDSEFFENTTKTNRFKRIMRDHGVSENITCEDFVAHLLRYYGLSDKKGNIIYSGDDLYEILARRFDMEYMRFDPTTPYVICEGADISLISAVKENMIEGAEIMTVSVRKYCFPGYASHILGRVGKIPADKADEFVEKRLSESPALRRLLRSICAV